MKLTPSQLVFFATASIADLQNAMYDIRDSINTRPDPRQVTAMLLANELDTTKFCEKKRPS